MGSKEVPLIPVATYNETVKLIPIATVEAVIVINGCLLFLRRKNPPVKGLWWFPGGRILKGETLEETLFREVNEETGLKVSSYKLINAYSRVFPERHDITIAYLCKCENEEVVLNDEHSEYALLKEMPPDLHPHLAEVMRDCGFKASVEKRVEEN